MPTFTVTEASQKKTFPPKDGRPAKQVLLLKMHEDGKEPIVAEEFCDATTPVPAAGEKLNGFVENTEYGWKFKRARAGGGGRGGRSPEEQKSIVRQHSQEMALRWMAIQTQRGKVPDDFSYEGLKGIVDWFVEDSKR